MGSKLKSSGVLRDYSGRLRDQSGAADEIISLAFKPNPMFGVRQEVVYFWKLFVRMFAEL